MIFHNIHFPLKDKSVAATAAAIYIIRAPLFHWIM